MRINQFFCKKLISELRMKSIYIILILTIISSCSATKKPPKCKKFYYDKFVTNTVKVETVRDNDTVVYNELRFECLHSTFYTGKVMFENFGRWDDEIYTHNLRNPVLIWKGIDLLKDGKLYDVFTYGNERHGYIYSSVLVFDQKNKDMFLEDTPKKQIISKFIGNLIKNQDRENLEFFETYFKALDIHYKKG